MNIKANAFIEATEFERLALDRYLPLLGSETGDTWDFREAMTENGPVSVNVEFISEVRRSDEGLRVALLPLVFGAAWKVLDLFLELALSLEGHVQDQKRGWSITRKCCLVQQGKGDVSFLGIDKLTWSALGKLYVATAEHRHCLIHRTASFIQDPIQLTGKAAGKPLVPLNLDELHAFIHTAQLIGSGVRIGGLPGRSVEHLQLCLSRLERHTGIVVPKGAALSPPVKARMSLQKNSDGSCAADFAYLHEQLARRVPQKHVDVWIEIPEEAGYQLFGFLENIPPDRVTIDLQQLPPYLEKR